MNEHTSTPWKIYQRLPTVITDSGGSSLGEMTPGDPYIQEPEATANAAFVVLAVNSYEPTLKALEELVDEYDRFRRLASNYIASGQYGEIDAKLPFPSKAIEARRLVYAARHSSPLSALERNRP